MVSYDFSFFFLLKFQLNTRSVMKWHYFHTSVHGSLHKWHFTQLFVFDWRFSRKQGKFVRICDTFSSNLQCLIKISTQVITYFMSISVYSWQTEFPNKLNLAIRHTPYLWRRSQHRADFEDLVNLAGTWEDGAERVQLGHNGAQRPDINGRVIVGGT